MLDSPQADAKAELESMYEAAKQNSVPLDPIAAISGARQYGYCTVDIAMRKRRAKRPSVDLPFLVESTRADAASCPSSVAACCDTHRHLSMCLPLIKFTYEAFSFCLNADYVSKNVALEYYEIANPKHHGVICFSDPNVTSIDEVWELVCDRMERELLGR